MTAKRYAGEIAISATPDGFGASQLPPFDTCGFCYQPSFPSASPGTLRCGHTHTCPLRRSGRQRWEPHAPGGVAQRDTGAIPLPLGDLSPPKGIRHPLCSGTGRAVLRVWHKEPGVCSAQG